MAINILKHLTKENYYFRKFKRGQRRNNNIFYIITENTPKPYLLIVSTIASQHRNSCKIIFDDNLGAFIIILLKILKKILWEVF